MMSLEPDFIHKDRNVRVMNLMKINEANITY